jgi:subtilisin family serine protease
MTRSRRRAVSTTAVLVGWAAFASALEGGAPKAAGIGPERQALLCPVQECPRPGSGEFAAADAEQRAICDSDDWALKQIGLGEVKGSPALGGLSGRGVMIAHVDTGYTDHPALPQEDESSRTPWKEPPSGALLPDLLAPAASATTDDGARHGLAPRLGFDFFLGCEDVALCGPRDPQAMSPPRDRLRPPRFVFDRQPGHGTGTAGMITAPGVWMRGGADARDRFLLGVAPGALVVPYRVSDGVIMSEERSTRVTEALLSAVSPQERDADLAGQLQPARSADVVTISFGRRSPSEELEQAILVAERQGVIVVAATGEYPFFSPVRFPAQYDPVIGVTGTKVDGGPWSGIFGAGRGPSAKVAAPAYRVWHAETRLVGGQECYSAVTGKGTSFSAPLMAGAAALWLERYNTPEPGQQDGNLTRDYGRAAIPALLRYFLRPADYEGRPHAHGFRSPRELCTLAMKEGWPNRDGVCAHSDRRWDTKRWGQGILAVDRLLSVDYATFPRAEELCREVYRVEGVAAWYGACPPGSPGRRLETSDDVLKEPPAQVRFERWTRVAGASVGQPFGAGAGFGPTLDYGIIFGQHYYRAPRGVLVQGKYGQGGNLGIGLGYGYGFGYDPFRDSKQSVSVFPGFGPAMGYGVKAAYLRAGTEGPGHSSLVGLEGQIVVLKLRAGVGIFRDLDHDRWRATWEFGVGY